MVIFVLCAAFLFAGCQPTPEKQSVVHRQEDIPQEAVKQTGTPESGDSYEPVAYKVSGHWKEDIVKSEQFSLSADVDVMMPEVSAYPVQKLSRYEMTQEKADELIAYFAGADAKFCQMPMPATKDYYEARLVELKQSLARVEAGGDGEDPESIRALIKEIEKDWADAPEENNPVAADTKFTYMLDYETAEPREDQGENYIYLAIDDGSGLQKTVDATRPRGEEGGSSFSYAAQGSVGTESSAKQQLDFLKWDRARLEYMEEPYKSEQLGDIEEGERRWNGELEKMAQNGIDLAAMQEKAVALLKDLGITGVQITKCENALVSEPPALEAGLSWDYAEPTEPACYIEFQRECGGIPCETQTSGSFYEGMSTEGMYCAPFHPECGIIVFDRDGNVNWFNWSEITQPAETVAADSNILSFEEAKDKMIDHLYWQSFPPVQTEEGGEGQDWRKDFKYRFEAEEVRLVMTYINVKDEPDKVMAVPAWYMRAQGYETYTGEDSMIRDKEMPSNEAEVYINALDGSPVLMPGITKKYE